MHIKPKDLKPKLLKPKVPLQWLDWPVPANVRACFTYRSHTQGINEKKGAKHGASIAPYDQFNFGLHVGDDAKTVEQNRYLLHETIQQNCIHWLQQVHGTEVLPVNNTHQTIIEATNAPPEADASFTREYNQVCCVMTADCLPVFFCDQKGGGVAIAHAGWRGLAQGVLLKTLKTFAQDSEVIVYLGPAISQKNFEVGNEVREEFLSLNKNNLDYFQPVKNKNDSKWLADLYGLARAQLEAQGVKRIYGGDRCTFQEKKRFYSYRRENKTGRMASLIWLEKP